MTVTEILPWLNLLLIPAIKLLGDINTRLARIETTQEAHAGRLQALDGIKAP